MSYRKVCHRFVQYEPNFFTSTAVISELKLMNTEADISHRQSTQTYSKTQTYLAIMRPPQRKFPKMDKSDRRKNRGLHESFV